MRMQRLICLLQHTAFHIFPPWVDSSQCGLLGNVGFGCVYCFLRVVLAFCVPRRCVLWLVLPPSVSLLSARGRHGVLRWSDEWHAWLWRPKRSQPGLRVDCSGGAYVRIAVVVCCLSADTVKVHATPGLSVDCGDGTYVVIPEI